MNKVVLTPVQVTALADRPARHHPELWPVAPVAPVAPAATLPPRFWHLLFSYAGQYLALLSILLVVVAPFVGNHYAQNDPYHDHIYLGGAIVEHDHDHPIPAPARQHRRGADLPVDSATGVISIPANGAVTAESAAHTVRAPLLPLFDLPTFSFDTGTGCCERLRPLVVLACDQPCLPLPDKPPRRDFWLA